MTHHRWNEIIHAIPTPLAGLALGIAGLGLALENTLPLYGAGQKAGAALAVLLLVPVTVKYLLLPRQLMQDITHPVTGSIMPTFCMALMIVSKAAPQWESLSAGLWFAAVSMHLGLLSAFAVAQARNFALRNMAPSWFIPTVGLALGAVTCPGVSFSSPAYAGFVFALSAYMLLMPIMLFRLLFVQALPQAAQPTLAILAAPASLLLASYLSIEPEPSLVLCCMLLGIALLMTLLVYMAFTQLFRLPFSPAYAAFTFPMAVSATALYKMAAYLGTLHGAQQYAARIQTLAHLETAVAAGVIVYVSVRYLMHYTGGMRAQVQLWRTQAGD